MKSPLIIGLGGLSAGLIPELPLLEPIRIGLIDNDLVSLSNLHRQTLYRATQIGEPKSQSAAAYLRQTLPSATICAYNSTIQARPALFTEYDLYFECSDDYQTKFLVNDEGVWRGRPFVIGAAIGTIGTIFCARPSLQELACYRCIFEAPPPSNCVTSCGESGVLGPVPPFVGAYMLACAYRLQAGNAPIPNLYSFDFAKQEFRSRTVLKNPHCPTCNTRAC